MNLVYFTHRGTAEDGSAVSHTIILLLRLTTVLSPEPLRILCGAAILTKDVQDLSKDEQNKYLISLLYQLGLVVSEEEARPAPEGGHGSPETAD